MDQSGRRISPSEIKECTNGRNRFQRAGVPRRFYVWDRPVSALDGAEPLTTEGSARVVHDDPLADCGGRLSVGDAAGALESDDDEVKDASDGK